MQPIVLNKQGQYATFKVAEPYKNVEYIRTFNENLSGIGTLIKTFRWSTDNIEWSYWIELTQQNLNSLKLNPAENFYIEYKYQLSGPGSMTIIDIQIAPSYKIVDDKSQLVLGPSNCGQPSSGGCGSSLACSGTGLDKGSILSGCTASFNPYAVNPAINLYKELSSTVSDMFGMEVLYMRAIPNKRSGDVIFKEWTLYNVDEPICTKVMVKDNDIPNNVHNYSTFGIEYEQPFEIEIVKETFERDFGLDSAPQKNDILFFPLVGTRLYEVQSSVPFRGFMLENVSWKVELTIYKPKSNRDLPESVSDIMTDILHSSDKMFGEEITDEIEEIAKPQQFDNHIGTANQDPVRSYISQSLGIVPFALNNHGINIAEHYYDLSTVFNPTQDITAVTYNLKSNFNETQNFAFTTWFKSTAPKFMIPEDQCKIQSRAGNTITFTIGNPRAYKLGDTMQIKRQGRLNFFGIIVEVINSQTYKLAISNDIITYLDSLSSSWNIATGYVAKRIFKSTYISGFDKNDNNEPVGWKLESFANKYFIYTECDKSYMFILDESLNENSWYAMAFNYAAQYNQINFNIYEINTDRRSTTELQQVYTKTLNNVTSLDKNSEYPFRLIGSIHNQTNLRIFKKCIPQEQCSLILNQFVVDDSHNAILIDNAVNILKIPYLGSTK